jgi:hypothetical protein
MKKYYLFGFVAAIFLGVSVLMFGCGANPTSDGAASGSALGTGTGIISGIASDESGAALSGVAVTDDTNTYITNSDGTFRLANISAAYNILVKFSKTGYVPTQQKVTLPANGHAYLTPILKAFGTTNSSFSVAAGGTVADGTGSVTINPNTLVDAGGTPVVGTVTVNFTSFDPSITAEMSAFPGDFAGRTSATGTDNPIETFGFVDITITDGSGNKVNLATGATAEVHIPIPASLQSTAPTTIDLWSYNETGGYWLKEGIATIEAGRTYYVGIVQHFCYWNCDHLFETGYIRGRVVDMNGDPVEHAYIRMVPIDYYGASPYWQTFTDSSGHFSGLPVKVNSITRICAMMGDYVSPAELVSHHPTSAGDTYSLTADLVLPTTDATALPTWQYVGTPGFSAGQLSNLGNNNNDSWHATTCSVYDGVPFVAYADKSHNGKATVVKYNGSAWEEVGGPGFSDGSVECNSLYFDNDGTPYVAFVDSVHGRAITVMKYTTGSWTTVGSAGFTANDAEDPSIYVYNGTPYIACSVPNGSGSGMAVVMKYTGATWEALGTLPNTNESGYICVNGDGATPYVVYGVHSYSDKLVAMKYTGTTWEAVGAPGFSDSSADYTSLYIDEGTPYVAYNDNAHSGKVTVMKYDGASWKAVGSKGFLEAFDTTLSLFVYNGTPYVTASNGPSLIKLQVMKYTGSSWKYVGNPDITDNDAGAPSVFVYAGTVYVSYGDGANGGKLSVVKYE